MLKNLFVILFISAFVTFFAQDWEPVAPDYKKIEKKIRSKGSDFYYPALMERYMRSDSTFTIEEKRHLYYGYTFQPEYAPYSISDYLDSVKVIMEKNELDSADYIVLLRYSDSLLAHFPFDIRALNHKLMVYDQFENETEFMNHIIKMNIIFDAILSSGDGAAQETAFYVISTMHEYDVLGMLGFTFGGQQSLVGNCDYLKIQNNQYDLSGLYFDVSPCLKHLNLMFK